LLISDLIQFAKIYEIQIVFENIIVISYKAKVLRNITSLYEKKLDKKIIIR